MVFSSPIFLFWFLPAVYIVYRLLPGTMARNGWLAAASLVFYSFGQPVYLPLLLLSVGMNYLFGRLMMSPRGRGKRWPVTCAVAAKLAEAPVSVAKGAACPTTAKPSPSRIQHQNR